jgi:hypothetical protein
LSVTVEKGPDDKYRMTLGGTVSIYDEDEVATPEE